MDSEELRNGIAAYGRDQQVILRLLRKRGSFTQSEFDAWFRGREWRRPMRLQPLAGDSFILGIGHNGGDRWAEMLDLLQIMVRLDMICAKRLGAGVVYSLRQDGTGA